MLVDADGSSDADALEEVASRDDEDGRRVRGDPCVWCWGWVTSVEMRYLKEEVCVSVRLEL